MVLEYLTGIVRQQLAQFIIVTKSMMSTARCTPSAIVPKWERTDASKQCPAATKATPPTQGPRHDAFSHTGIYPEHMKLSSRAPKLLPRHLHA